MQRCFVTSWTRFSDRSPPSLTRKSDRGDSLNAKFDPFSCPIVWKMSGSWNPTVLGCPLPWGAEYKSKSWKNSSDFDCLILPGKRIGNSFHWLNIGKTILGIENRYNYIKLERFVTRYVWESWERCWEKNLKLFLKIFDRFPREESFKTYWFVQWWKVSLDPMASRQTCTQTCKKEHLQWVFFASVLSFLLSSAFSQISSVFSI